MEADKHFNDTHIVSSNRILYTPSSFARTSLLHLQEIGELKAEKAHTSNRSDILSFLYFIVIDGEGKLEYQGRQYCLKMGDSAFINCQHPYSHRTDEVLWTIKWIHFYGPSMALIYDKYLERGGQPVFEADTEPFLNVHLKLFETAGSNDYMRDMIINELLATLLRLLMEQSWHPESASIKSKKTSANVIREYLEKNYKGKITLDELADIFYINKYYLTRVFKEQFGISITSYLKTVRITHAKQLLRFSDMTVEEIGYESGIGALNYFSRVFKEVEGVSPSVYREQW